MANRALLLVAIAGAAGAAPAVTSPEERIAALRAEDPASATAALEALSLTGGEGALEAIADYLDRWKGNAEMERRGHSALRRLPVDATSLSRAIAGGETPSRRAWAAWTAGEHRTAAAADALLGALKDPDPKVRLRAVAALGVIGDPRAQDPILKIVVHDPDPSTRERAEQALAVLGAPRPDPEPLEPLLTSLQSADVFVRLAAVKDLVKRADRRAVGPVIELLGRERDLEVRKHAVEALAAMKDEIAVPRLIEIARADHAEVRRFAVGALAVLDDSRAVEPLVAIARDPDASLRRYALRALRMLDRPGCLAPLLAGLSDPVPEVRTEAAAGLSKLGAREGADALAARLPREPDPSLRELFAVTLGELGAVGHPAHEDALLLLLEDEEARVRASAAAALARIGSRRTGKALERMVERERKKKPGARDLEVIRIGEDAARQVRAREGAEP